MTTDQKQKLAERAFKIFRKTRCLKSLKSRIENLHKLSKKYPAKFLILQ